MHIVTADNNRIQEYTTKGWWGSETLASLFDTAVAACPNRLALTDPPNKNNLVGFAPQRLTYCELERVVNRVCWAFQSLGLQQYDRVVVQMPNTVEIVAVYLAAAKMGVIVSPVAMQYRHKELESIVATVEPRACLFFSEFEGEDCTTHLRAQFSTYSKSIVFGSETMPAWISDQHSSRDIEYFDETRLYCTEENRIAKCDLKFANSSANDIFTICWTSGTTGRSKGVPRSHNHWLSTALTTLEASQLREADSLLNPFPLINMASIGGFLYVWLQLKSKLVLHHPFDAEIFLSQLQSEEVSYTIAPPALLNLLLAQRKELLSKFDLSNLRCIGSGSAPLAPEMIKGFKQHLGIEVLNFFGSNEGMAIVGAPQDVADSESRALYFPRFGADGFQWSNEGGNRFQSKLVDLDTGKQVEVPDVVGELLISGPTVFDGYYRAEQDNAVAFTKDGFFRTGDLFEIAGDKNQYYRFVGRCKDLIVRGGFNISPEEIDMVLQSHPKVIEGAVCSYPDEILGEKICAVLVLQQGEYLSIEELGEYMQSRGLAKFKWPEKIVVVDALPRNPLNKVPRAELSSFIAS